MLSGFNTNFRYRGVLFHVQTEDSGLENPHVITHLFHGGNIMASEKRDYSEFLGEKDGEVLEGAIRELMQGLHKSMLKRLSRGEHDAAIEQRMGPGVFGDATPVPAPDPPLLTDDEPPPERASAATPKVTEAVPPMAEPVFLEPEDAPAVMTPDKSEASSRLSRVFGDRVVSEKPLDEVVLDYLVEKARKRKRSAK